MYIWTTLAFHLDSSRAELRFLRGRAMNVKRRCRRHWDALLGGKERDGKVNEDVKFHVFI
jgi:hypothetical protein